MDRQHEGRSESEKCGHRSCGVGDSGQKEVKTDHQPHRQQRSDKQEQENEGLLRLAVY